MKSYLTIIPPAVLLFLIPDAGAQHCGTTSRRVVVRREAHYKVHEETYVPVAFVDLVQTYFTFPQVQLFSQVQPQQVQAQSVPTQAPNEKGIAQSLDLPPAASYGTEPAALPTAGGNSGELLSLLSTSCASCHTGPSARGSFQLFSPGGSLNPQADLAEAWVRIKKGEMPPGRPLEESLKSKIRTLIFR